MELDNPERKEYIDFIRNIDQFFNGDYLGGCCDDVKVSAQMGGRYEGGVEIKGAKYVVHIGTGRYFVFTDFANRTVDFKVVTELAPGNFGVVSVGKLEVGDINDDIGKNNFAKEIGEFFLKLRSTKKGIVKSERLEL